MESERHYLVKAQEAEALADAANDGGERNRWELIAAQFRARAKNLRQQRVASLAK